MVIDSSVLIAILLEEPEAEHFTKLLIDAESSMVIEYKKGALGAAHTMNF